MNTVIRILKAPWLATVRSTYGYFMLIVYAGFAAQLTMPPSSPWSNDTLADRIGITALLLIVGTAWKLVVNTLWLARDAKALRLPGIERDANAVPVACAVLSILLPAAVLGLIFGHVALWFVSLGLVAAVITAFCLLPAVMALPAAVIAVLYVMFIHHLPLPGNPGYLDWALPVFVVLSAISIQRWVAIARAATVPADPWWRPATMGGRITQLRRLGGGARGFGIFGALAARTPEWKRKASGLRNVGPDHPIRSLRLALDRSLVPFDLRVDPQRYWRWRVALVAAAIAPPVVALLAERRLGIAPVLAFAPQLLLFAAIVLTVMSIADRGVYRAWCGARADLSSVALLPNLVRPARAHRDTVLAGAAGYLLAELWCTYSCVMLFAVLHLPAMFYAYLLLMLATGVAMQFAATTGALCGRRWHRITGYVMYSVVFIAAAMPTVNWGVRVIGTSQPHFETLGWPAVACVALWVACCAAISGIAFANWRRFRRQPHPFLVHPAA